ncbi:MULTISPECIES: SDR family NAD(P)-dependent oxidoreductase [unclassified Arthrobacter]|uniref:SDR family NAD(P)-dependent oxidoreductase n=1 Tax=unclassified Arthrobacter TaxID=235627 RepID=UPI002E07BF94|nr:MULTISPECIES: SDR family NAD(P)-dependent oxidoreductase [unclassified Arthrobacter]MEC5191474.1 NAD(P)-dependent dehydrogenase (short-subunit alcohol dehydrogenase family) [Arthrobacter sp. MP_M4]MEC5203057.1 NAD(P)-dependent dehydrogenase (short-subunit alcohol dehydrogenase family) [Arthrobacter sp. MP_M7]
MGSIFITGSSDGLGRATAESLLGRGHQVIVHARNADRLASLQDLLDRGAAGVVGDLSDAGQTRDIADQVNRVGPVDVVVHNAGVLNGPHVFHVNVVAPYLLTALIGRPRRLIYLSSGMHRSGHTGLASIDWNAPGQSASYADSKLYVTALAAAVARLWPDVLSNAVDPGWVPTKMGGPGAPDDLRLGHLTQEWLATSDDQEALTSGGYWHHQRLAKAHPAVHDVHFQEELVDHLARVTGERLL